MRGREFHIVLAIVPGTWTDTTVLDAYKPVADAFVAIEDGDAIALTTGQRDPADIISLDDIAKVSTALAKDALQEAMELALWRGIRENGERSRDAATGIDMHNNPVDVEILVNLRNKRADDNEILSTHTHSPVYLSALRS